MGYLYGSRTILNAAYLQGLKAAGTAASLIGINASDQVSIDPGAIGAVFGGKIILADGTALNPIVTFGSDLTMGLYRIAANSLGVALSGTLRVRFQANATVQASANLLTWASDAGLTLNDVAIGRQAAGILKFANASFGYDNEASLGAIGAALKNIVSYTLEAVGVPFASLPTGVAGMFAYVTDSNTNTWGATVAGGGANKVLAFFNGTVWTVAGK